MTTLHVAAAAINTTPKDWAGNTEKIMSVTYELAALKAELFGGKTR